MSKNVSVSSHMTKSKLAIKETNIGFVKYFMFTITSWIGKLMFLSFPLFALSEYHLIEQIKQAKPCSLEDAFEGAASFKKYWITCQFALIYQGLILTLALIIWGLTFGLDRIGAQLDDIMNFNRYYTAWVFQWGAIILGVIGVYQISIMYAPVVYLIYTHEDMTLSEALKESQLMMTGSAKRQLMGIHLSHLSLFMIKVALGGGLLAAAYYGIPRFFFILILVIVSVWLLTGIPRLLLSVRLSSVALYDTLLENASYESLFDASRNKVNPNRIRKEEVLIKLFEDLSPNVTLKPAIQEKEGL